MIFMQRNLLRLRNNDNKKAPSITEGAFNVNDVARRINQFQYVTL